MAACGKSAVARRALWALAGLLTLAIVLPPAAQAQGWWPWANQDQQPPPRPREPVWRGPPPGPIPGQPAPGAPQPGQGGTGQGGQAAYGSKAPICLQLEQRLVQEGQRGTLNRDQLPRLESDLRQADRAYQSAKSQLERGDCYDYFLFSKTLRQSRQCVELNSQVETNKRRVMDLDAQRQQILGTRDRSHQDDILRELARNNCGSDYQREVQKRGLNNPFSSLWQDEEAAPSGRGGGQFGALPYATYRTVCVRLCDGYFFPISFSTLKNHFDRDIDACQSKCAAPAELYYYQNPGGNIDQALSVRNQSPYMSLKTAKRYQKEYVQGCSCKQAEYTPTPGDRGDRKAEAPVPPPPVVPARQIQR